MIKNLLTLLEILGGRYKFKFFTLVIISFIGALIELFGISLIIPIYELVINNNTNYLESILPFIGEIKVYWIVGIFFLAFFVKSIIVIIIRYLSASFAYDDVYKKLSLDLFNNYLSQNYQYFKNKNSSHILRNIVTEVQEFSDGALIPMLYLITEIILMIVILLFLIFIYDLYIFLFIFPIAILGIIYYSIISKKLIPLGKKKIQLVAHQLKSIQNIFGAIKEIKVLSIENFFKSYFIKNINSIVYNKKFQYFISGIPKIIIEILFIGIFSFILLVAHYTSNIEFSKLAVLVFASMRLIPSFTKILTNFQNIKFFFPLIEYFKNELELKVENNKIEKFVENEINQITLKNICFTYDNSHKKVIENISIEFIKGELTLIMGESGSGKTTLTDILSCLIKPDLGEIYINTHLVFLNNKYYKLWNDLIGYVPQNIFIFDETLKFNIILNKEFNQHNYNEVLKVCNLIELEREFSLKSNMFLGERGSKISGGQKQRIGIARSLYQNKKIIICDEASSALDDENEINLINNLNKIKKDKIIIFISHRDKYISKFDKVIKIKKIN